MGFLYLLDAPPALVGCLMSRPAWLSRVGLVVLLAAPPGVLSGQGPVPRNDSLLVSTEWLAARLDDPRLVILQLGRDSAGYLAGHIPGARFVSLGSIVVERDGIPSELPATTQLDRVLEDAGVSNDSRVVLYGDPLPVARMFFTLDYVGMGGRAALLDGGLAAWQAEGRALSREHSTGARGSLEPRIQRALLVDAAWLAGRSGDTSVVILDARSPEEWSGQEAGEGVTRPGHIPGSANVYWRRALTVPEPARLEQTAVLTELLDQAGVSRGKTVVTYCRIGVQSTVVYFVARYLGYEPKLYDGSFVEWSGRADLPVAR